MLIGHRVRCIHLKLFNELLVQKYLRSSSSEKNNFMTKHFIAFSPLPQLYEGREKERMCVCVCVCVCVCERERDFGGNNRVRESSLNDRSNF